MNVFFPISTPSSDRMGCYYYFCLSAAFMRQSEAETVCVCVYWLKCSCVCSGLSVCVFTRGGGGGGRREGADKRLLVQRNNNNKRNSLSLSLISLFLPFLYSIGTLLIPLGGWTDAQCNSLAAQHRAAPSIVV